MKIRNSCFQCLILFFVLFGTASLTNADIILSPTNANQVIGGKSILVDLFYDFEGSDAQLAVVASDIRTTANLQFADFTLEGNAVEANEDDFNLAFFYPFPNLLNSPTPIKLATLEFQTSAVTVDSLEVIDLNVTDNNGGLFFDRANNIPSFTNQSLEILVLASVPEPTSVTLVLLTLLSASALRRKKT